MGVSAGFAGGRSMTMDTLVRMTRRTGGPAAARRLAVPERMSLPLGCDAVVVPADLAARALPHLPRVGCVYADGTQWWWIVPADSDYAMTWPEPVRYVPGAVLPEVPRTLPELLHAPDGTVPYTPPIPLYLALCQVTGAAPAWSTPVTA
ncbi:hypothetical protein ABT026_26920 [Streptomyces sp. NPDC002734]|uniref:hypothetical protein n=1 Tax=Streptomyces sp. NPDC002734 TaxID=3154426 RepID=UPI003317C7A0